MKRSLTPTVECDLNEVNVSQYACLKELAAVVAKQYKIQKNELEFLILFIYSMLMQLFGLYIISSGALFVFVLESLPFLIGSVYIYKNKYYIKDFEVFLLLFSLFYGTIWVLANDNLGTAVRLRVPSYLVIFACMFIVYQEKSKLFYVNKINRGLK